MPVNNNGPKYEIKGKVNSNHSTLSQLINEQSSKLKSKTKQVVTNANTRKYKQQEAKWDRHIIAGVAQKMFITTLHRKIELIIIRH